MNIPYTIIQPLEAKVEELCDRFDVVRHYEKVRDHNPANDLPYHNWYHTLCMVEKCVEGANWHNLPWQSIRNLIVAALFHDYAHSGGRTNDTENIARAVRCLANTGPALAMNIVDVEQIIRVTEYPYVLEPVCIEHRIIRDADLMQVLRIDTWEEMVIHGLRKEIEVKLGNPLSVLEMCAGQIDFLRKIKVHSDWGKEVFYKNGALTEAIDRIRMLG